MDISVSGRKIELGEAFKEFVIAKLSDVAEKYFSRVVDSSVVVAKEGHLYKIACHMHAPNNVTMQSHGEASEVYAAFDAAVEKIEKQLRRYKRRIKNHHKMGGKEYEAPDEVE